MKLSEVTIIIPTFRRPNSLRRLLLSVENDLQGNKSIPLIIVDNDIEEGARIVVEEFREQTGLQIDYRVAPVPGVSNARNVGMEGLKTPCVLFLDDDMEVVAPYLEPLLRTAATFETALTFAPAVAKLPPQSRALSHWLGPLFSRVIDGPSRIIVDTLGTGGCLVNLDGFNIPTPPFDPSMNEIGGEDDAFFDHIVSQRGTVGWCAEAKAWEHVPPHRATLRYLFRRSFAYGQSPSKTASEQGLSGIPSLVIWMFIGFIQGLYHGTLLILKTVFRRPSRIYNLSKFAEGLGKIFWGVGFSPRFYGSLAQ